MAEYIRMNRNALEKEYQAVRKEYQAQQNLRLNLNMARGKPGSEQLALVSDILHLVPPEEALGSGVRDVRNYGMLSGLPEAKNLFAELLGCKASQCFIGGNSSLQLMYQIVSFGYQFGLLRSPRPWREESCIKWLCPVPGYDRHFRITELLGIKMINIPMLPTGPDMDLVEELIKDPQVKGMWCVPKFSNPDGIIYSEETIDRIAALHPAAEDFTVMWDNAYCVHEFEGEYQPFRDILSLAAEQGNPHMVVEFSSTSKITFPGAGVSVMAASEENIAYFESLYSAQIISFDKLNQLRHVLYLKDRDHTLSLMRKHGQILKPRFDCVLDALEREIGPRGLARWQRPKGGYFVSVYTLPGLAKRTLEYCTRAGVVMTAAGATYPYGLDPEDSNLRIAPSFPPVDELEKAMHVFCLSLRLAALEQML